MSAKGPVERLVEAAKVMLDQFASHGHFGYHRALKGCVRAVAPHAEEIDRAWARAKRAEAVVEAARRFLRNYEAGCYSEGSPCSCDSATDLGDALAALDKEATRG